jgi:hypothetical protein
MSRVVGFIALAGLALTVAGDSATAQEGVDLAFKFTPGEVMDYDISMSGSGGLRAPDGDSARMGLQGNLRLKVTVAQVLPDGNARLQLLIPDADIRVTIGAQSARLAYSNGRVRWYADGREQAPPDADITQVPLLGVPLEFVASPKGQILDVVLPEIAALAGVTQMAPGLSTPQLEHLGDPMFPDHPVVVGETWRRSVQVSPFGPTMPMTVTSSRTLDSYTDQGGIGLAKISGHTEARLRVSRMSVGPPDSGATLSVPEMRETITSTEFFNPTAGQLVRAHYEVAVVTSISFSGAEEGPQEAGLDARLHATIQAR